MNDRRCVSLWASTDTSASIYLPVANLSILAVGMTDRASASAVAVQGPAHFRILTEASLFHLLEDIYISSCISTPTGSNRGPRPKDSVDSDSSQLGHSSGFCDRCVLGKASLTILKRIITSKANAFPPLPTYMRTNKNHYNNT